MLCLEVEKLQSPVFFQLLFDMAWTVQDPWNRYQQGWIVSNSLITLAIQLTCKFSRSSSRDDLWGKNQDHSSGVLAVLKKTSYGLKHVDTKDVITHGTGGKLCWKYGMKKHLPLVSLCPIETLKSSLAWSLPLIVYSIHCAYFISHPLVSVPVGGTVIGLEVPRTWVGLVWRIVHVHEVSVNLFNIVLRQAVSNCTAWPLCSTIFFSFSLRCLTSPRVSVVWRRADLRGQGDTSVEMRKISCMSWGISPVVFPSSASAVILLWRSVLWDSARTTSLSGWGFPF